MIIFYLMNDPTRRGLPNRLHARENRSIGIGKDYGDGEYGEYFYTNCTERSGWYTSRGKELVIKRVL